MEIGKNKRPRHTLDISRSDLHNLDIQPIQRQNAAHIQFLAPPTLDRHRIHPTRQKPSNYLKHESARH